MSLGQSSTVRAVPAASLRKVSKFGTVASHQDRLPAYRSGALSRSGRERVNSAVEWHTQNRCFRTRKIVRIRGAHKGDGAGMQLVVREISHLYPAYFPEIGANVLRASQANLSSCRRSFQLGRLAARYRLTCSPLRQTRLRMRIPPRASPRRYREPHALDRARAGLPHPPAPPDEIQRNIIQRTRAEDAAREDQRHGQADQGCSTKYFGVVPASPA